MQVREHADANRRIKRAIVEVESFVQVEVVDRSVDGPGPRRFDAGRGEVAADKIPKALLMKCLANAPGSTPGIE